NRPEGGAELSFTIPIHSATTPHHPDPQTTDRHILVVDDDPDIQQLLHDRLKASGYLPSSALDGRQALSLLHSQEFDGMILDIGIGQIDGLEVLRRVRMTNQRLPVLMITASGSQELAMKAIGLGAQAYLLKPFDTHQLQETMDRWFGHA
ncbi:MAG: hypothetical protein CCU26_16665, partial [Nitrospira sp. UW-LDO-01]